MAKNRNNVRIYGDLSSGVFVAPKGTTGPTAPTATPFPAPPAAFVEVGWTSDDGVNLDRKEDTAAFTAWQSGTVVRKKVKSVEDTLKFTSIEENPTVLGLYYKGVTPTTTSGVDHYAITNQARSDERAWVVDFVDGGVQKRIVAPSGEVTERASVSHKNSDLTMYEYTVTIYGDYDLYVTSAA